MKLGRYDLAIHAAENPTAHTINLNWDAGVKAPKVRYMTNAPYPQSIFNLHRGDVMNIVHRYLTRLCKFLLVTLLWIVLITTDLDKPEFIANAASANNTVIKINGEYQCSGECVVKANNGWKTITVPSEKDTIRYFSDKGNDIFYRVDIEGDQFHEVEIGSLIGSTLRTATAQVCDDQFPVLEEYLFDKSDSAGYAQGFTKIVRNPSEKNFKSCVVYCEKKSRKD